MNFKKNITSPQGLRIIELCYAHPAISVEKLAELSGFSLDAVCHITNLQRKNGNIATEKNAKGGMLKLCYVVTPKGVANAGIVDNARAEPRTSSSDYIKLDGIQMVSYRPGAWDANAIARRGQPC